MTFLDLGSRSGVFYEVFGNRSQARKSAVILGPVAPVWRGGDFCEPLAHLLVRDGYVVYVIDSVFPLREDAVDGESLLDRYVRMIQNVAGHVDLLSGYALGGALALMLAKKVPGVQRALSLSGPGFPEAELHASLMRLVELLGKQDLAAALRLLSQFVAPAGTVPAASHLDTFSDSDVQLSCERMKLGFEFLLMLDARPALDGFKGRVLSMLGAQSQLANLNNLAFEDTADPNRRIAQIDGSGMRILLDNPQQTLSVIQDWLKDE
jgi:pimeloyl-ACP methyl ester carboxylesterase